MSDTILEQPPDDELSPIYNLEIYNKITPIILISLGSLYVSILIFRCLSWRYRKRKAKKMGMDRQKLERFWRKQAAYIESQQQAIQKPLQSYSSSSSSSSSNSKKKIPKSFDSTATLVVVQGGHVHHLLQITQEDLEEEKDEEEEAIVALPYRMQKHHYTTALDQKRSKRHEFIDIVTNRRVVEGHHERNKRRQLLWQWSVAMGYTRYNHGYQLDLLINRLLQEKTNKNRNNRHKEEPALHH